MRFAKNYLLLILLMGFLQAEQEEMAPKFWVYLRFFDNKTPIEYVVSCSCEPSAILPIERTWKPLLRLLPHSKTDIQDSAGRENILLKDPLLVGCTIKIAPANESDTTSPRYYIRQGIKASGSCVYGWLIGPYDLEVSPVDFLRLPELKEQEIPVHITKVRYCGYQNSKLGAEIYLDGISIVARHRSLVIDKGKHVIAQVNDKKEEE